MDFTLISPLTANAKLGKGVATSYRPVGDSAKGNGTCPSNCMFLPENGGKCYTRKFLVNNQQRNAWKRNDDLDRFLQKGATHIRLHTSGDFFSSDGLDRDYLDRVIQWCQNNPDIIVWTYTHNIRPFIDNEYSYKNNSYPENLYIVASCDTIEEKLLAIEHGYKTSRVIQGKEDKMDDETFCPYDLFLFDKKKPTTNCKDCTLCFNKKHKRNIAFLQH